jgi:hypothetical protein
VVSSTPPRAPLDIVGKSGALVVASLLIVLAMLLASWTLGKVVDRTPGGGDSTDRPGVARLQAFYLAEMALNDVLFDANQTKTPGQPGPFAALLQVGGSKSIDYTDDVWLTRSAARDGGGSEGARAVCKIVCTAISPNMASFRTEAAITLPAEGTFAKALMFSIHHEAASDLWVLLDYHVEL